MGHDGGFAARLCRLVHFVDSVPLRQGQHLVSRRHLYRAAAAAPRGRSDLPPLPGKLQDFAHVGGRGDRPWVGPQPAFKQAALEYHGSIQRLKSLASNDIPSAVNLLTRIIDSLEAYLRVAPPSFDSLAASPGSTMAPDDMVADGAENDSTVNVSTPAS